MNRLARLTAVLVTLICLGVTPAPSPAPLDAVTILQRMESRWDGLSTYQVPVTISGHVRASIISLPFKMTGTQYYQAPDRLTLHIDRAPSFARGLGNTVSAMGSPQTWSRDYALQLAGSQTHGHHEAYVLNGTPKRESRVKSVTMQISAKTYAVETMTFNYTNGATLVVEFTRHHGLTQYHLPRSAALTAKFPSYSGNATIEYGAYQVNQPIPSTAFAPQ